MPRRYNLRTRKMDERVKWVEDDTLKNDEDSESEDEDYEPPSESEESEDDVSLVDEDEEEEEEPEKKGTIIQIPMPKVGTRVKIEIDARDLDDGEESDTEDEDEDEDEEEFVIVQPRSSRSSSKKSNDDDFLDYLMSKYVPSHKVGKKSKKEKEEEEAAMELNDEEQEYFDELSRKKRKQLNEKMKSLSKLVSAGDVPIKFRVVELPIADNIKAGVIKKIDILNEMGMESSESYKLRSWVDAFLRIPFGKYIPLPIRLEDGPMKCANFLSDARKTMDSAVYGMNPAKTQIMQILAQLISNPSAVGNVIALKGPAGVGKTSFAKHGIAEVLKRPFEFFSLGGASDAANFVGHSYTYEGSTWGRVADSLMTAQCMNPVLYFDELDKISETHQGQEIVSMLIHLTDRSQNSQFHDRYFAGVDFDLSQCVFVFSFNDENKLSPILKDRMQVIHCSGYNAEEKKKIVSQYVWPQMLDRIKMKDQLSISEDAIKTLIEEHSKDEEGVRTLIRTIETLVTRINLLRIADEETAKSYPFYTKVTLPLTITPEIAKHVLQDGVKSSNESWRGMYI